MRLTMVPKTPLNDSYSYRIQTKHQSCTILINKVLLIMCSAVAVIQQKRIVKNVSGWVLGNIITVVHLQFLSFSSNHCTSSVDLDHAVKIAVVFLPFCQTCCCRVCNTGPLFFWKMKCDTVILRWQPDVFDSKTSLSVQTVWGRVKDQKTRSSYPFLKTHRRDL